MKIEAENSAVDFKKQIKVHADNIKELEQIKLQQEQHMNAMKNSLQEMSQEISSLKASQAAMAIEQKSTQIRWSYTVFLNSRS